MRLVDTDIIIFALRKHQAVLRNMREHVGEPAAVSVLTTGELLAGALKSSRPVENLAEVRAGLRDFEVIDVTSDVMELYASVQADLERRGQPIGQFDTVLAATALSRGLTLVTNNEEHFRRVPGLSVENWTK